MVLHPEFLQAYTETLLSNRSPDAAMRNPGMHVFYASRNLKIPTRLIFRKPFSENKTTGVCYFKVRSDNPPDFALLHPGYATGMGVWVSSRCLGK